MANLGFYVQKVTPPNNVGAIHVVDGTTLGLGAFVRDGTAIGLGVRVVVVPSGGLYVQFN